MGLEISFQLATYTFLTDKFQKCRMRVFFFVHGKYKKVDSQTRICATKVDIRWKATFGIIKQHKFSLMCAKFEQHVQK
jgi:hypothetical protein